MTRLYLFAEGQTEQAFGSLVLAPHLAQRGIYLARPRLIAHARKRGRTHRGGLRGFRPMQNDIQRCLREDPGRDVRFTTMVDLYGLPGDFPGMEAAGKLRRTPYERVRALENAWAEATADERFIPYLQLHEFEACLFASVATLCDYFGDKGAIRPLDRVAGAHESPELIDDGRDTAPSKRIQKHLPAYGPMKPSAGPQAAARIGLDAIRAACPHFGRWLERLEELGET